MIGLNNTKCGIWVDDNAVNEIYVGDDKIADTYDVALYDSNDSVSSLVYTSTGSPVITFNRIVFGSSLDIIYMNSGVSCRKIKGTINNLITAYYSATSGATVLTCNFTNKLCFSSILITVDLSTLLTVGYTVRIICGDNSVTYSGVGLSSGTEFGVYYANGKYTAYVGSYSVSSETVNEDFSRLELAGSNNAYNSTYTNVSITEFNITNGIAYY